jgi:hypothetical protein
MPGVSSDWGVLVCGLVSNTDKRCWPARSALALGPANPHKKTKANFFPPGDPENCI